MEDKGCNVAHVNALPAQKQKRLCADPSSVGIAWRKGCPPKASDRPQRQRSQQRRWLEFGGGSSLCVALSVRSLICTTVAARTAFDDKSTDRRPLNSSDGHSTCRSLSSIATRPLPAAPSSYNNDDYSCSTATSCHLPDHGLHRGLLRHDPFHHHHHLSSRLAHA